MRKIIILWATCRPITFLKTHSEWMRLSDDYTCINTFLAVDTIEQAKMLPGFDVIVTDSKKAGVCYPSYCLSSRVNAGDDDLVIFASDDFFPSKGWDTELKKRIDIGVPQVLIINDGIQKYPSRVVTLPIMNYSALEKMNKVVYHPAYSHMWSDVELFDVAEELKMVKDIRKEDKFFIEHRHYCNGKRVRDEKDLLVDNKYREDKEIHLKRKQLSINDKLIIPDSLSETVYKNKEYFHPVKLSVLICTITSRKDLLKRLLNCLHKQIEFGVEILIEEDDGKIPIGAKRNTLIRRARGEYCCFIDDDDLVSENYISEILKAIKNKPDCCSLKGIMTSNGENPVEFYHSIEFCEWFDKEDEKGVKTYFRCPNHLNVIKTSICNKVMFNPKMNIGEDRDFSERVLIHLKKEQPLDKSTYFYLFVCKRPKNIQQEPIPVVVVPSPPTSPPPPKPKAIPAKHPKGVLLFAPWRA